MPVSFIIFSRIAGKETIVDVLTGSLQVDIFHIKEVLVWKLMYTVDESFESCFR